MRIVKTIPISSPTKPPAPGGNTKAPGGGVAKAPGGGVAKNSGGRVGITPPGGGVGQKLKENAPPLLNETGAGQSDMSSQKRCSTTGMRTTNATNADPPSTPTSTPARVGSDPELPARPVANPAAAAITRKMRSAPRLSSGTINGPAWQRSAGCHHRTAVLAASVHAKAMNPPIPPQRSQAG